jgi:hypothetical protein
MWVKGDSNIFYDNIAKIKFWANGKVLAFFGSSPI